jgi:hypothetical protein
MIFLKSLLETTIINKTLIVVDIQPEYQSAFGFKIKKFTNFINENYDNISKLVFLYNGIDTVGELDEMSYKSWLSENGLDENVIDGSTFYDKGYAFFRYCMDRSIDESATINFVRFMYENNINDSREMNREMWTKYLRQYRRTDKKQVMELLQHSDDMINIPDLMNYIKRFNNITLTGGGINECLKEVEIALGALNMSYNVLKEFTY